MAARGTVGTGNAAPRGRPAELATVSERPGNENPISVEVERRQSGLLATQEPVKFNNEDAQAISS